MLTITIRRWQNVVGGCYHVASYEQTNTEEDSAHYKMLKPSIVQVKEYLNAIAMEKNITKCPNSSAPLTGLAKSIDSQ